MMAKTNAKEDILKSASIDAEEVAFFANISDSWWDPDGPFKPLHQLNPTRVAYSRDALVKHFNVEHTTRTPLKGLRILDIGCGGGLLSEPLTRLGATMVSIDATEKNIKVAKHHADMMRLDIDYRHITAEGLAEMGEQFDAIINMEVIEHVADVDAFLATCKQILKPNGIMLVSTLNRTIKSLLLAKIGAEYILRWLPIGAHDWNKFIKPHDLEKALTRAGFTPTAPSGFVYNPLTSRWKIDESDLDINYVIGAIG